MVVIATWALELYIGLAELHLLGRLVCRCLPFLQTSKEIKCIEPSVWHGVGPW